MSILEKKCSGSRKLGALIRQDKYKLAHPITNLQKVTCISHNNSNAKNHLYVVFNLTCIRKEVLPHSGMKKNANDKI